MASRKQSQSGFTLVELSIVLVIIGLIVGGVLVGQDLIKAAEIRATISQIEKYNAAVNTFRTKYGGIPGDLLSTRVTQFGFPDAANRTGANGLSDGDGLIEDSSTPGGNNPNGEVLLFWSDLSFANLVDGSFTGVAAGGAQNSAGVANVLPGAKLGRGNYVIVYNTGGFNYYQISGVTGTTAAAYTAFSDNITPTEAQNIDEKVDDSLPAAGSVQARGGAAPDTAATAGVGGPAAAVCIDNAVTPNRYNVANTTTLCQLRLRFN